MAPKNTKKEPKYKRIVLKISGEILRNKDTGDAIDPSRIQQLCTDLKEIHEMGIEVALVLGGGNIFRGLSGSNKNGVDRTTGDFMGMLATIINGLAFLDSFCRIGVDVRLQSAIPMNDVAEPFILRRAIRHLEKRRIVIFVGGTGNPYFSTDTAAALRASEINAQVILKATKVDGIYDKDPHKFPNAKKFEEISFLDALKSRLNVMDSTAFSLCLDNNLPILVFNIFEPKAIQKAVMGQKIGTLVN